ncbi:MAG: hypothetical protein JWL71_3348 [Acidobacteria bacterium]|nr:hypothetical protein [Acidobacteriota bacterium]
MSGAYGRRATKIVVPSEGNVLRGVQAGASPYLRSRP